MFENHRQAIHAPNQTCAGLYAGLGANEVPQKKMLKAQSYCWLNAIIGQKLIGLPKFPAESLGSAHCLHLHRKCVSERWPVLQNSFMLLRANHSARAWVWKLVDFLLFSIIIGDAVAHDALCDLENAAMIEPLDYSNFVELLGVWSFTD